MLEQDLENTLGDVRLKRAGGLVRKIKAWCHILRRERALASGMSGTGPAGRWILENADILERELLALQKSLAGQRRLPQSKGRPILFGELSQAAREGNLGEGQLEEILSRQAEIRELDYEELCALQDLTKAALLERIVFLAQGEDNEDTARQIGQAIGALRGLGDVDFLGLEERYSPVDRILRRDPAGVYGNMDANSRRQYRSLLAKLARAWKISESKAAGRLLERCKQETDPPRRHIGYWLLRAEQFTLPAKRTGIFVLSFCAAGSLALGLVLCAVFGIWPALPVLWLCLWEIFWTLACRLILPKIPVRPLPRMELNALPADEKRTAVVISTLLPSSGQASQWEEKLEELYFANRMEELDFLVLADPKEANAPEYPQDNLGAQALAEVIRRLNEKYGQRFHVLVRRRRFLKTQGRFGGWERKRGALMELCAFLNGEDLDALLFEGDAGRLRECRYLLALDADTNLLFDCASKLIATAAHPLNEPKWDAGGLVYEGYGILTPRIQTQPGSALKTLFSRVMAGRAGSSPYDTHSRDFYQDAFGSSVFCGKGLINRRAMDALLPGRFPQNRVLSHDILEGSILRTGFVGDVSMSDSFPSGYLSWNARLTRWIRGDWQNAPWIVSPIRGERDTPVLLPALSRWQLWDNLRRSVTPPAAVVCLAVGAFTMGNAAWVLAIAGVLAVCLPNLWGMLASASRRLLGRQRRYFGQTLSHTAREALGALYSLAFLPQTAWDSLKAAAVALWRRFKSKKKLLEWTTAAQSENSHTLGGWYRRMAVTCVLGAVLAVAGRGLLFQLLGLLFLAAPALGYACAREKTGARAGLTGQQREEVAAWCAQMWQFYEHYAGVGDHFLPPDNVQLAPVYRVAHRTSPTNIGMMLLSALAAADFGFLAPQQLCRWVSRVLDTVESLERWHGNLYNWYDTQTLAVLEPGFVSTVDSGNFVTSLVALETGLREYAGKCPQLLEEARRVRCIIDETDLSVFYRKDKGLFSIGYDPSADTLHSACYDFLMSEARATSYFAVATRQAPKKHWNSLSRALSRQEGYVGPLSWTGTMFEYLMPHLLLPAGQDTFLSEAVQYAIWAQRRRAAQAGVPWGISESAYFAFDAQLNYQYKAHGVQKLGVKEGLDRELVLSPYSTFLALPFVPQAAMKNLHRLQQMGLYGVYGFYEAVDCTPSRAPQPQICRSYMAHHVGMSIAAGCNAVFEGRMQKRFMKGAQMRCAREFLEEQLEEECVVNRKIRGSSPEKGSEQQFCQEYDRISPQSPRCMLYSNGDVHLLSTDCGAAQLNFRGLSILRPGEDLLRSPQGIFICLGQEGTVRTLTAAPGYGGDAKRHTQFSADSVSYHLEEDSLQAVQQLRVHRSLPAVQVQLQVKNRSRRRRRFEALYYLEPVLCRQADYQAHPAFSKLFVTARLEKSSGVLLFQRRLRPGEAPAVLGVSFLDAGEFSYETRREKLIGPEGGICLEQFPSWKFSGGGGVPDAVCALRRTLSVSPRGQGTLNLLLACAPSESEVLEIITRLRHEKGISQERAAVSPLAGDSLPARLMFQLLPRLLYPVPRHRASREEILNRLERRELWSLGVSGDFPIVLCEAHTLDPLRGEAYLKALKTLRERQVPFDLVFAFPKQANTTKSERDLTALIHRGGYGELLRARGGVHLVHPTPEQLTLLRTCSVYQALRSMERTEWIEKPYHPAGFLPCLPREIPQDNEALQTQGGVFSKGRFYVRRTTPIPYTHVLATPVFGTQLTDRTLGFTWAVNCRENKLTPWQGDIAAPNRGEALLLRINGKIYSLTDGALCSFSPQDARYEGQAGPVHFCLTVSLDVKAPVKILEVRLRQDGQTPLQAQCAYYLEPVLGVERGITNGLIFRREDTGELVIENPMNSAVSSVCAVGCCADAVCSNDRARALCGEWEPDLTATRVDPCALLAVRAHLEPGEELTLRFALAWSARPGAAVWCVNRGLTQKGGQTPQWIPNRLELHSPQRELDAFLNGFCGHQIFASRIFARCGFYQNGGAYGFRDQLQDVCAGVLLSPQTAKRQILRAAAVQFPEGDVLHWWHALPPHKGGLTGVRTRYSDDLLWLVFAVEEYVNTTSDSAFLRYQVPYVTGPELTPEQKDLYFSPQRTCWREGIYEHCVRAIRRTAGLRGAHGLPLMRGGDWNDGFNLVGSADKGESVWLGLFYLWVLRRFEPLCQMMDDTAMAQECARLIKELRDAVEASCWDGGWYLRAFYDSGEPMGSAKSQECRIDSLSQSFAVFAGGLEETRVKTALDNAWGYLVDEPLKLARLFTPPFADSPQNPGYVKSYPRGIRENGGQYTHAAVWLALALLQNGETERGMKLINLLNPVQHCLTPQDNRRYLLEPYYMAADIYTNPDCPGRGGWSMYTGAAGWYYQLVYQGLLGMRLQGDSLTFSPKVPKDWDAFSLDALLNGTRLKIRFQRLEPGQSSPALMVDGAGASQIPLDKGEHQVLVVF